MYTWVVAALLLAIAWLVLAGLPGSPMTGASRVILAVGCIVIVLGYFLLGKGPADNPLSLIWGPLLLVIGYCALIPVALLRRQRGRSESKR